MRCLKKKMFVEMLGNQDHSSIQAGRWEPGEHLPCLIDAESSHEKLCPKWQMSLVEEA